MKQLNGDAVQKNRLSEDDLLTGEPCYEYDLHQATIWVTKAQACLHAVFQLNHSVRKHWDQSAGGATPAVTEDYAFEMLRAMFEGALQLVEGGLLDTLEDGIRLDSEADLLEQASALNKKGYCAAAAVLGGGALESHLHHLCRKNDLTWKGHGSISAYDAALAKARNEGNEIYAAADTKSITAWGGIRNDAAHSPGTFADSKDKVEIFLAGIGEFLSRAS